MFARIQPSRSQTAKLFACSLFWSLAVAGSSLSKRSEERGDARRLLESYLSGPDAAGGAYKSSQDVYDSTLPGDKLARRLTEDSSLRSTRTTAITKQLRENRLFGGRALTSSLIPEPQTYLPGEIFCSLTLYSDTYTTGVSARIDVDWLESFGPSCGNVTDLGNPELAFNNIASSVEFKCTCENVDCRKANNGTAVGLFDLPLTQVENGKVGGDLLSFDLQPTSTFCTETECGSVLNTLPYPFDNAISSVRICFDFAPVRPSEVITPPSEPSPSPFGALSPSQPPLPSPSPGGAPAPGPLPYFPSPSPSPLPSVPSPFPKPSPAFPPLPSFPSPSPSSFPPLPPPLSPPIILGSPSPYAYSPLPIYSPSPYAYSPMLPSPPPYLPSPPV